MMRYPVKLKPDSGGFVVTFPDVPGAITEGDSKAEALHHALDALEVRQKVRPIELARRMGVPRQEVTRVLNLKHNTKIDTTAQALAALGKRLELRVA
jgi:antitoxin HicB